LIPNQLAKNLEVYLLRFDSLKKSTKEKKTFKYIEIKEKKKKKIHLKEIGLNF